MQQVSALCSNCYIYKAFFAYPLTENSPKYFTEGLSSQKYAHACVISTLTRADIQRCVGQAVYFCKVFGDTSVKIIRIWPCALHFYIRGLGHTSGLFYFMPVHIGKFIQQKLKEDGRSVTWFASKIYCTRSNVYKIFANDNIDIKLLKRISLVLNFNFFDVLAQECFDA